MKENTCKTCKYQKAKLIEVIIDEDGNEIPVFERKCTIDGKLLNVLDFRCGLWEELT